MFYKYNNWALEKIHSLTRVVEEMLQKYNSLGIKNPGKCMGEKKGIRKFEHNRLFGRVSQNYLFMPHFLLVSGIKHGNCNTAFPVDRACVKRNHAKNMIEIKA